MDVQIAVRMDAGCHLVEDHAHGIQIRGRRGRLQEQDFGCDVGGSPDHRLRIQGVLPRRRVARRDPSGEPEIQNPQRAIARDAKIAGFEVPVNDAGGMRRREALRELQAEAQGFGLGQRAVVEDPVQRVSLHELHHDAIRIRCGDEVVNDHDGPVIQSRERERLPSHVVGFRQPLERVGRQELERHVPSQDSVPRAIDGPLPPAVHSFADLVAADRDADHGIVPRRGHDRAPR
jgi:hypothetical protein